MTFRIRSGCSTTRLTQYLGFRNTGQYKVMKDGVRSRATRGGRGVPQNRVAPETAGRMEFPARVRIFHLPEVGLPRCRGARRADDRKLLSDFLAQRLGAVARFRRNGDKRISRSRVDAAAGWKK